MKSKAEEIKQFESFLGRVEKGGYLDMMFGNLLSYVKQQITNDFGVDIKDIIQGYEQTSYDLVQANRKIKKLEEDAEIWERDYRVMVEKRNDAESQLNRIEGLEAENERLKLKVTELIDEVHKWTDEYDQANAERNRFSNRIAIQTAEIGRLKGILFDRFEEVQKLKKKLGE